MTDQQVEELTCGLARDVGRLRPLLEGRTASARTFDLAGVLEPAVASARASGSDVRCSVQRGIAVVGDGHRAAQVVLSLLGDARRHAPARPSRSTPASSAARWRSTSKIGSAPSPTPCVNGCSSAATGATLRARSVRRSPRHGGAEGCDGRSRSPRWRHHVRVALPRVVAHARIERIEATTSRAGGRNDRPSADGRGPRARRHRPAAGAVGTGLGGRHDRRAHRRPPSSTTPEAFQPQFVLLDIGLGDGWAAAST